MTLIAYLAMLLVGLVLGLIGGGGAILTMPILVYLFAVPATLATSYSLFIVGAVSLFGVWRYHLQGLVDYTTAVIFALPSFVGTYLARQVLLPAIPSLPVSVGTYVMTKDQLVMTVFAVVMLGASLSMINPRISNSTGDRGGALAIIKLIFLGLAVGFLAGFVGAGGGFLIIPALVVVGGLPINRAIATSLFIISMNSMVGFMGDLFSNVSIDWPLLLSVTGMSAIGLIGGTTISKFIPPAVLKVSFGWFVLVMGAGIFIRQFVP